MKTVILEVASVEDLKADFVRAWKSGKRGRAARVSFATPELLWKVLTAERWALLKEMTGAGPIGVRELSRRVGRDVRGVNSDVTALVRAGVIDRQGGGKLLFPYERVEVRFDLQAA